MPASIERNTGPLSHAMAADFPVGAGFKPQHLRAIAKSRPALAFFEVHAENYMGAGGAPHRHLMAIRQDYALSIHGVGLSLGGAGPMDETHLARLAGLVRRYEPFLVSEHLAWSTDRGRFLNDLLPLPYTREAVRCVADHVDRMQEVLGRQILLENPSTYLGFDESRLAETEVLAEIALRTGCGLLLDVNNVLVSCTNHGGDPAAYLAAFPMRLVGEIHLAGHARRTDAQGRELLVDSHDQPVCGAVWDRYADAIARAGPVPTLIERDADIPPWADLYAEACRARAVMAGIAGRPPLALAC